MVKYGENGKQYHTCVGVGDIGEYVILPGDPKRVEKIAKYLDNPKFIADNREYLSYTGTLNGEKVSVVSTGIGGPSAAIAMEELVQVGAKHFIRIGTCGGMDINVKSGDVVIATGAVRMEGTSKEYAPMEWPAVSDFETVTALVEAAKKINVNYHTGIVECKDSFFGQHEADRMPVGYELINKWNAYLKLGCLASEMESAALFVVANALHVKCGTVLMVVANQEREKKNLTNPIIHDTDLAIKVAVSAIKVLIEKGRK